MPATQVEVQFNASPVDDSPQQGDIILGPDSSGTIRLMAVASVKHLKSKTKVVLVYSTPAFSTRVEANWEKLIEGGKYKHITVTT